MKPETDFEIGGGIENYKNANRLDNLITLCQSCHMIAERAIDG